MAERQEIEVFISEDGYIKYHLKGLKGPKCLKVGEALAKVSGEAQDVQLTEEYYEQEKKVKDITKQKLK